MKYCTKCFKLLKDEYPAYYHDSDGIFKECFICWYPVARRGYTGLCCI